MRANEVKKPIYSSTYAYVYLLIVATEVIKLENLIKIFTMSILLSYVLIRSLSLTFVSVRARMHATLLRVYEPILPTLKSCPTDWDKYFVAWLCCMNAWYDVYVHSIINNYY